MKIRSPVAKHLHKSCKSSIVLCKKRSLLSDAIALETQESLSEGLVEGYPWRDESCYDEPDCDTEINLNKGETI
jgi:hypothetical protein